MGRRPTPIEERIAAGTVRPDRHARVPVVMGGRKPPVPAAYLTAAQKREFRRLVRELHGSRSEERV